MTHAEPLPLAPEGPDFGLPQATRDGIPTFWVDASALKPLLARLKRQIDRPYRMLFDLTAIDERMRQQRGHGPAADFTLVYHLFSLERCAEIRLKVALAGDYPSAPTITDLWPSADWYEREVWDMFGIRFEGHPNLRRILMPPTWEGHPLRKDHPARATEIGPYRLDEARLERELDALRFRPESYGMPPAADGTDYMFLNLGPNHPSAHGVFRILLQLTGEQIVEAVPDIGFHHRAAEKMGERQSWHTYIPYTDRVDYLGGVMNNLPYVLAVEQLAGIEVPPRVEVIRVMLCELFRIANHLLFYGTFAQDVGQLSPVFYMFSDRERLHGIIESICGGRMHPGFFRIGGVAYDLPKGWEAKVREFLDFMPKRLDHYRKLVLDNRILKGRTQGIGGITAQEAIEWGMTGPNLRAAGVRFDLRKARPYSGYQNFEFDIPAGESGDCYDRALVHAFEIEQSLRIVRQCVDQMPAGPYKSLHPATTPPLKERTLHDIETLIHHFLGVSWGPVLPPGEACFTIEGTKGLYAYYLTCDGQAYAYRTRIRTASFPHLQTIPRLCKGLLVPDLVAILGSLDFVMSDVDR